METLLMMDRVDAELADRRKKLKKSGSITEGSPSVDPLKQIEMSCWAPN
jgi:hypothetical protein